MNKTKKLKKSQIQIGETIAVLLVFFILIVIGFIFYTKVLKGNIETEKEELSQKSSIGIAQRVMFLPELQCSEDVVKEITNCIDVLKLDSARDLMRRKENEIYYYDLLEFGDVSISQIYPVNPSMQNLNIYSRRIQDFKSKFITNVPVSLYDPVARKYAFGILTIETLSK